MGNDNLNKMVSKTDNQKYEIPTPPSPPCIMFQAFVGVGVEGSSEGGRGSGSGGGGCSGSGCNCGGCKEDNNADRASELPNSYHDLP